MWPDRVSNLVPLAVESDALLTVLRGRPEGQGFIDLYHLG